MLCLKKALSKSRMITQQNKAFGNLGLGSLGLNSYAAICWLGHIQQVFNHFCAPVVSSVNWE